MKPATLAGKLGLEVRSRPWFENRLSTALDRINKVTGEAYSCRVDRNGNVKVTSNIFASRMKASPNEDDEQHTGFRYDAFSDDFG